MANTWKAIDGRLGVRLDSNGNIASGNPVAFAYGTRVTGNANSTWTYVYASSALVAGAVVAIRASGTATSGSTSLVRGANQIGIAQWAFAAGDSGFVAMRGQGLTIATTGAAAVGAVLYMAASSAGRVTSSAASTNAQLAGVRLLTTASGTSASTATCVADNIVVVDPGFLI